MAVRYIPVMHDGSHTMEQQMLLLARAAADAWKLWCGENGKSSAVQGVDADFDGAMRRLYEQCYQTDVFMGGVHHGQGST